MATAFVSGLFAITIEGGDLNVAKTFTAPRSFTVVGISANNDAAAASTITITGSDAGIITGTTAAPPVAGAGVVQAQSVAGPVSNVAVIAANSNVDEGETIAVVAGAASVTKVILWCVADGGGEAITIS